MSEQLLLSIYELAVQFPIGGGLFSGGPRMLRTVDGVSLTVNAGEWLGLVGESGSGKSTLALAILGRAPPTSGRIMLDGQDVASIAAKNRKSVARVGLRQSMPSATPMNSPAAITKVLSTTWRHRRSPCQ